MFLVRSVLVGGWFVVGFWGFFEKVVKNVNIFSLI